MRKPVVTSEAASDKTLLGGNRRVKLDSSTTDGDIYLVEGVMPEGSVVPPHVHTEEDEIFHVLEGRVKVLLGDQVLEGKAGDIIYLPRGVRHGIRTLGEDTARVLNYVIPGRNFEAFFNELSHLSEEERVVQRANIAQKFGITFLEELAF